MLGDKKPSQFLTHLRNQAQGNCSATVLRSLFFEHMPENVRAILAGIECDDLDNLAKAADRIIENTNPGSFINSVQGVSQKSDKESIADLQQAIANLTTQVQKLMKQNRSRSRSRSRNGQNNFATNDGNNNNKNHKYCWKHFKFGAQVQGCKPPCLWNQEHSSSNQEN